MTKSFAEKRTINIGKTKGELQEANYLFWSRKTIFVVLMESKSSQNSFWCFDGFNHFDDLR